MILLCVAFLDDINSTFLHRFAIMQVQVDIGFDQLIKIVKTLP